MDDHTNNTDQHERPADGSDDATSSSESQWMDVKPAATSQGTSLRTAYNWIAGGNVETRQRDGKTQVRVADFKALRSRSRKRKAKAPSVSSRRPIAGNAASGNADSNANGKATLEPERHQTFVTDEACLCNVASHSSPDAPLLAAEGDDEELSSLKKEIRREELEAERERIHLERIERRRRAEAQARREAVESEFALAKATAALHMVNKELEGQDEDDGSETARVLDPPSYNDELAALNRQGRILGRQAAIVGSARLAALVADGVLDVDFADLLLDELPDALGLEVAFGFQPLADFAAILSTVSANLAGCVGSALESMLAERGIPTGGRR